MGMGLRDYLWKNRRRFTCEDFAQRLKVNPEHLSRVAAGKSVPSVKLARKIHAETNGEVIWHELIDFCYLSRQDQEDQEAWELRKNFLR